MARPATAAPPRTMARGAGFAGGVNLRDAINLLGPDEARTIENMILDERGGGAKRKGTTSQGTFGVGADRALSIYPFYKTGAATQVLMQTTAGKLYYTANPAANPVVWTQIATGLSATAPFSFETFNSKCYFSNGVDNYASWDGAAYTTFPTAPKGKFLRIWRDTMWVSGVSGLADRVYASSPGDPETYPGASWVDIAKGDGDSVTALATDNVNLIVGKQRRGMVIYDAATFANRVFDFEKGFESHFGVAVMEGQLYYFSRRGICEYLGDTPSRVISFKIDPLFTPEIMNLSLLSTVWAYTFENRVGWVIPEAGLTYPSLALEYYPRLAPISQFGYRGLGPFAFHRMPVSMFVRVRSGATDILYGTHNAANKFVKCFDGGTDDGAVFTGVIETSAFDFGAPGNTKYIRRAWLLGRGKFNMQIRRDFQTAIYKTYSLNLNAATDVWSLAKVWGQGTWGPDALFKELMINPDAYLRYAFLRFSDVESTVGTKLVEVGSKEYSVDAGEWAIYGIVMEAEVLGVRS